MTLAAPIAAYRPGVHVSSTNCELFPSRLNVAQMRLSLAGSEYPSASSMMTGTPCSPSTRVAQARRVMTASCSLAPVDSVSNSIRRPSRTRAPMQSVSSTSTVKSAP